MSTIQYCILLKVCEHVDSNTPFHYPCTIVCTLFPEKFPPTPSQFPVHFYFLFNPCIAAETVDTCQQKSVFIIKFAYIRHIAQVALKLFPNILDKGPVSFKSIPYWFVQCGCQLIFKPYIYIFFTNVDMFFRLPVNILLACVGEGTF